MKWHGIAPHLVTQELEEAGFHVLSVEKEFTSVRGSSRKALMVAER